MVDAPPLHLEATATATNVGRLRRALRRWLTEVLDDPDAVDNVVLAASEALENAVDHAFAGREPGGMTLHARHEPGGPGGAPTVVVVVSDDGHWQAPDDPGYRGRGLELIGELVDAHRVRAHRGGTTVTLRAGRRPD